MVRIQTEVWSKSLFKGLTSNLWFSNFSLVVGLCRWKGVLWINQNNFRSVKHVLEKQPLLSKVRLVHMRSIHYCVNDKIVHIGIKIHWELMLSRWSLGIILHEDLTWHWLKYSSAQENPKRNEFRALKQLTNLLHAIQRSNTICKLQWHQGQRGIKLTL